MGEILSDYTSCVDSTSTLLWKHVKFLSDDDILIFLPCTKTKKYNGEFVDVFATKDKFCCPVSSLKSLMQKHIDLNIFSLDQPVFFFWQMLFSDNQKTKRNSKRFVKALVQPPDGPDIRPLLQRCCSKYNAEKFANIQQKRLPVFW
jgi:hypothetical protein